MNYLVVVAHPDDEVLGAGGTIYKLIQAGHQVAVATLVSKVQARANISDTLLDDEKRAMEILGVTQTYHADFPNIKMNTVPHLEIVQFVEHCIQDFKAEAIITHHPAETNNDHVMTSYAVQAAARTFQRKPNVVALKELSYMEVLSSTEWSLDSSARRFTPNCAMEIGQEGLNRKMEALSVYKGVMRDYPHPRSDEALRGLAAYRGAQFGCMYAEAFDCVFRRMG